MIAINDIKKRIENNMKPITTPKKKFPLNKKA